MIYVENKRLLMDEIDGNTIAGKIWPCVDVETNGRDLLVVLYKRADDKLQHAIIKLDASGVVTEVSGPSLVVRSFRMMIGRTFDGIRLD